MNEPLDPAALALARARTYGLVAEIVLDGWTPRAVEVVEGLPWAASLPTDPDRRAARHQEVFGRSVPPYASVFLSPEGLLGGPPALAARRFYGRIGFGLQRNDVEPDHLGLYCAAMAYLCGAEADALRDGVDASAPRLHQRTLLQDHLGPWLRPFVIAVRQQGVEELSAVTGLLLELVESQVVLLEPGGEPEHILDDPEVGLKEIARYLLVPARSGWWLSLHDIQRVAERAGLACGFGRRVQMMESLLHGAAEHGRLGVLVEELLRFSEPWGDGPRMVATRSMLERLAAASPVQMG